MGSRVVGVVVETSTRGGRKRTPVGGPRTLDLGGEFLGSTMGHLDRSLRLEAIAAALSRNPSATFPEAFGTRSETEAAYDFFANPRVHPRDILEPHHRESALRCMEEHGDILLVSDTTEVSYNGVREGLGPLSDGRQGFFLHSVLALRGDGTRHVLGVLDAHAWVRPPRVPGARKKLSRERYADPNKESLRWGRGVDAAMARLEERASGRVIHVMDREADDFALLHQLVQDGRLFVIRVKHDRRTVAEEGEAPHKLFEHLDGCRGVCTRKVRLSRRLAKSHPKAMKNHPPREYRDAVLSFCAGEVGIARPYNASKASAARLPLNLVRAWEESPPDGDEPVEWRLFTNLPVGDADAVLRVVDIYRDRWTIEDFHKALKAGCSIEKRQLESGRALINATMVSIPLAYGLLRLRTCAATQPDLPARELLTAAELTVLTTMAKLPKKATVADALAAVARLGGHMPNNGAAGWLVLTRGYRKFRLLADYEETRDA